MSETTTGVASHWGHWGLQARTKTGSWRDTELFDRAVDRVAANYALERAVAEHPGKQHRLVWHEYTKTVTVVTER